MFEGSSETFESEIFDSINWFIGFADLLRKLISLRIIGVLKYEVLDMPSVINAFPHVERQTHTRSPLNPLHSLTHPHCF